jgi:hypothetical protein
VNLSELREAVRGQVDMDSEELDDARVDLFLQDGFNKIIELEQEWPFFEQSWTTTYTTVDGFALMPADVEALVSVINPDGRRLNYLAHDVAEDTRFRVGDAWYYSIWGNRLFLWAKPDGDVELTLRGWRTPEPWGDMGPAESPDCDERFHIALVYYACSLVYAQQEDELLEQTYMARFERSVQATRQALMRPHPSRPRIMFGNFRVGRQYPSRVHLVLPES